MNIQNELGKKMEVIFLNEKNSNLDDPGGYLYYYNLRKDECIMSNVK